VPIAKWNPTHFRPMRMTLKIGPREDFGGRNR
jgi:hypothetical protein